MLADFLSNDMMFLEDSVAAHTQFKATSNREGEWYVKLTGADIVSWLRAGGDTLKVTKASYTTSNLNLAFSIGSADNTAMHTAVHIDDFTITGGGGSVTSDTFDKNSITDLSGF